MYGAWALWYVTAVVRAGMVELVDAPDSKSGGLRPLGVRVPLPALVFQRFSTIALADLDKIWTKRGPDLVKKPGPRGGGESV